MPFGRLRRSMRLLRHDPEWWTRNAAGWAAAAIKGRKRYADGAVKEMKREAPGSRGGGGNVVSHYQQNSTRYIKSKRLPKKVLKRRRMFKAKVEKVLREDVPLFRQVFRNQWENQAVTAGLQGYGTDVGATFNLSDMFMLYGMNAATNTGNDVERIAGSVGDSSGAQKNYKIPNGLLEMQFKNLDTTTAVNLELYYCVARKDIPQGSGSPSNMYTSGLNDLAVLTGNTGLSGPVYGVTPFNSPEFCTNWKIYKITRHRIDAGQVLNLQERRTNRMNVTYERWAGYWALKGQTICVFPLYYGDQDSTNITTAIASADFVANSVKTYSVRPPLGSVTESGGYQ